MLDLINLFTSWLLVSVILIGTLTLACLRAKAFLPAYEKMLTLNVWLLVIHAFHVLICRTFFPEWQGLSWAAPYGLMYPVLLFFCFKSAILSRSLKPLYVFLHCFPAVLFTIAYVGLIAANVPENSVVFGSYRTWLFRLIIISFIGYSLMIWSSPRHARGPSIAQLLNVSVSLLVLLSLLFLALSRALPNIGFDAPGFPELMTCGIMLAYVTLLFWHKLVVIKYVDPYTRVNPGAVHLENLESPEEKPEVAIYQKSAVTPDRLAVYEDRVRAIMIEEQLFLDPQFNLGKLSAMTGIPKHHLSQVFSLRFGKGFATMIGELRINYAVALINESEEKLNIEALAYECGFNSKVSFNRHFKQLTGVNPSAYRKGHTT